MQMEAIDWSISVDLQKRMKTPKPISASLQMPIMPRFDGMAELVVKLIRWDAMPTAVKIVVHPYERITPVSLSQRTVSQLSIATMHGAS